MQSSPVTNAAAYRFAHLEGLKALRVRLLARCQDLKLKGTILLSREGINLFIAGQRAAVGELLVQLRQIPGLEDLEAKYSLSDRQPFTRMLVRIKREIIAFGVEGIDPASHTVPKLSAQDLRKWLDEGRTFTLLDTRNDYEVKLGTFVGAKQLDIGHFRQFPEAAETLNEDLKRGPVVTFCTGGIRCEKAGPYLEKLGFEKVFQLEGGILKYFEECGGAHYEGECFVFDQRVGVDPALAETETTQCHACQSPLRREDQQDPRYVAGESCPFCATPEDAMAERIAERQRAWSRIVSPLPGSQAASQRRPVRVPGEWEGQALVDFLSGIFPHVEPEIWRARCQAGELIDKKENPLLPERLVRAGEEFFRVSELGVEPEVNVDLKFLYEDEAILVLNKPAPLPMHPAGRFERNTLQFLLNRLYAPQKPRSVHRLDAATTGVVVFARTRHFARILQEQFSSRRVEKIYQALVCGQVEEECFSVEAPIGTSPSGLGGREVDERMGAPARTDFQVLERRQNNTTLLEARPITGRTNQIRVHLWQRGHPVCGDPAYLPTQVEGEKLSPDLGETPLALHARSLRFIHPVTGAWMRFQAERPGHPL